MNTIARNWKAIFAFVLAAAAALIIYFIYKPENEAYEREKENLQKQIIALEAGIVRNKKYEDIQPELEPALEEIAESRRELYELFPVEMKEEDQILYLLHLEEYFSNDENGYLGFTQELHEHFGSNIYFSFAQPQPIQVLSDGAVMEGMDITVFYHAGYDDFKGMVHFLATDSRVASVRYSTFTYTESDNTITGQMQIRIYLMNAGEYTEPDVEVPSTGKDNIFTPEGGK